MPPFRLYLTISLFYFVVITLSGASKFFFFNVWGADAQFAAFVRLLPRLMFLLLPAFALLLALLYRGQLYAEHLIFALHYHAFAFLLLPIDAVIDPLLRTTLETQGRLGIAGVLGLIVGMLAQLATVVYLFCALRRVYGGYWPAVTLRTLVVLPAYLFVLAAVGVLSVPMLRQMVWTKLAGG